MAKNHILIVDDNDSILFNLKLMLELNNYEVLTASNCKSAIGILKDTETIIDVIISDILMPDTNGYEFFKEISIHPKWKKIPFIFLTALASPDEIKIGKQLGVDDYVTKPIDDELLLRLVKKKLKL